jgi:mono/diheme cytochrome c family protein
MKFLKWVAIVIGVLVLLGGGAAAFMEFRSAAARSIDPAKKFQATPERLERGKYLVTAETRCLFCHSEHDWKTHGAPELPGRIGAGWVFPAAEMKMPGKVISPNITAEPETGLGAAPDDAIARALREGVGRDGHALFPMMPWMSYRLYSDEDVASIVVYLRTLAPVKQQQPPTELIVPVRWILKGLPKPLTGPVIASDQSDPIKRGRHLAEVGSCLECHTPHNDRHDPLPGMELAGGDEFRGPWGLSRAANITPHASGIAHYDEALFVRTMRTGNIGGRRLNPIMPWLGIRNLTDADLKALWAYLKSVKPVAHDVVREAVELQANPLIDEHPEVAAAAPAGEPAKAPAAATGAPAPK